MEKTVFGILLFGILLNNYALKSFLGITNLLGNAKSPKKSAFMGLAVTIVTVLSSAALWPIQNYVLGDKLGYLQTLVYVTVILAVSCIAGALIKIISKKDLGVFFPLLTLNSAVLGVALTNATQGLNLVQSVLSGLGAGVGFTLAMLLFCGVMSKLEDQYIPRAFRGLPVQLMAACILALALYAF